MKVTYPLMGNLDIGLRAMMGRLGLEIVEAPPISKRTLSLGVQYSPEFACLPFKVNLGNFIEALERGADTIVVAGGKGPCRFGYFGQTQAEILKSLGYKFKYIIVEAADGDGDQFAAGVRTLANGRSTWDVVKAVHFGYRKLCACDLALKLSHKVRASEVNRGETTRVFKECLDLVDSAATVWEVKRAEAAIRKKFAAIPVDRNRRPLKIGLVGEIYFLLEPAVNLHVEERLGEMGVVVRKSLFISDWVRNHIFLGAIGLSPGRHYRREALPYLSTEVGGHGMETVGKAVQFSHEGCDGLIQVAPFTCMPEIVSKSILPSVSYELGIPVMSLFLDEHSGEAGFQTRLEAFCDLLARRKKWGKAHARLPRS